MGMSADKQHTSVRLDVLPGVVGDDRVHPTTLGRLEARQGCGLDTTAAGVDARGCARR
jgi:hypothetical protein